MGIGKHHPALGESIHVRRSGLWMPVEGANPIVQIVNGNEKNVRLRANANVRLRADVELRANADVRLRALLREQMRGGCGRDKQQDRAKSRHAWSNVVGWSRPECSFVNESGSHA